MDFDSASRTRGVATLQTLSFTHIENLTYTSVMTTGNLRRAAKKPMEAFIPNYNRTALHDASLPCPAPLRLLNVLVHQLRHIRANRLNRPFPACMPPPPFASFLVVMSKRSAYQVSQERRCLYVNRQVRDYAFEQYSCSMMERVTIRPMRRPALSI